MKKKEQIDKASDVKLSDKERKERNYNYVQERLRKLGIDDYSILCDLSKYISDCNDIVTISEFKILSKTGAINAYIIFINDKNIQLDYNLSIHNLELLNVKDGPINILTDAIDRELTNIERNKKINGLL